MEREVCVWPHNQITTLTDKGTTVRTVSTQRTQQLITSLTHLDWRKERKTHVALHRGPNSQHRSMDSSITPDSSESENQLEFSWRPLFNSLLWSKWFCGTAVFKCLDSEDLISFSMELLLTCLAFPYIIIRIRLQRPTGLKSGSLWAASNEAGNKTLRSSHDSHLGLLNVS